MPGRNSALWRSAAEIFDVAVVLEGEDRESYIVRSCDGDEELEGAVRDLLSADSEDGPLPAPAGMQNLIAMVTRLRPGTCVGPWRVVEAIGAGGMGTVYLAERDDAEFRQRAAIKVLTTGLEAERFRQERQVLAALGHPNIASLLDGGQLPDGRPYVVMEYVEGIPLDQWAAEGGHSLKRCLSLFRDLCRAVAHAHGNLVVHRDIKPANVLVSRAGRPKLLDFGIAKILSDAESLQALHVTEAQARVMTPGYAAPEQIEGRAVSTATDIYALGVLLYELIVGHRPFAAHEGSRREHERAVLEGAVKPPSQITPLPRLLETQGRTARGDLDSILLRLLTREPQGRYRTVAEIIDDIDAFIQNRPVRARRATRFYAFRKLLARNPASAATIGSLATLTLVLLGTSLWQANRLRIERDAAVIAREQADFTTSVLIDAFRVADPVVMDRPASLEEVMDRAYTSLVESDGFRGEVPVKLLVETALALVSLAKHDKAERLLLIASSQQESEADPDAIARVDSALAHLYLISSKPALALAHSKRVLESPYFRDGGYGQQFALTRQHARILVAIGETQLALGHAEHARRLFELDKGESIEPFQEFRLWLLFEQIYSSTGDDERAANFLLRATKMIGQAPLRDADQIAAARALSRLGHSDVSQGEKITHLLNALDLSVHYYGERHPMSATVHREIGNARFWEGDYEAALVEYRIALQHFEAAYESSHSAVVKTQYNVSLALRRLGQESEARNFLLEAISGYESRGNVRSTELPYFYWTLGRLEEELSDSAAAELAYRRSIELNAELVASRDQLEELAQASASLGILLSKDPASRPESRALLRQALNTFSDLQDESQLKMRAEAAYDSIRGSRNVNREE